jgi:NADH dehydrogenase FAD-containing subunit
LAFAAQHAFLLRGCRQASVTLVTSENGLLSGHASSVKSRVLNLLKQRGIVLHCAQAVGTEKGVTLANGVSLNA